MGLTAPAHPETRKTEEYARKAEFICNFTKFVRWPGGKKSTLPLRICILGRNDFESVLGRMGPQTVRGRPIQFTACGDAAQCIGRIKEDAQHCHVLFISHSTHKEFAQIFSALKTLPILTIGDAPGFAALGGIINLIQIGDQLRFEINTAAAARCGLTISSQLLKLARLVTPTSAGNANP